MLVSKLFNPLKTWSHGVVKHTHKNLIEFVWLFCGIRSKKVWYIRIWMYVSIYALFCCVMYRCFVCIWYAYICMHLCISIFVCVYIYVRAPVYIYACVYVCFRTHFYLYKSYLFNCLSCRYLDCYLLVWHCYLGSILAFTFEFQNLNTNIFTNASKST